MSSAALLLLIPLAWLAVTLLVVAACRVTARAEAEGQRPPGGGAGGLSAVSSTTGRVMRPAHQPLEFARSRQLSAVFTIGGDPAECRDARVRRQPTGPARVRSH